jgi:predicted HicB family RNase H-like nuclease
MSRRSSAAVEYDSRLNIVLPSPLSDAVAAAAAADMTSINQYVRAALLAKLRADGVKLKEKTAT